MRHWAFLSAGGCTVKFSKKEHLLVFRHDFNGPVKQQRGDKIWSLVSPVVFDKREYYKLKMNLSDPLFKGLNEEFKGVYGHDWNGEYLVPCFNVQFSEEEESLRSEREQAMAQWGKDGDL